MELELNWSGLLPELLGEIACRTGSAEDFSAFRGVCTAWRSSATKVKLVKTSRVPLLMLAEKDDSDDRELYSLFKRRIGMRITLPESKGKRLVEVRFGWLLTLTSSGEVTLLNPISRAHIHLPNYTTFPNYGPHRCDPDFLFIERAVLSDNPSDDPTNFVLFVNVNQMLGYWRSGDKNWTRIQSERFGRGADYIEYYNKKLYMVRDGRITVWDPCGSGTGDFKAIVNVDYDISEIDYCNYWTYLVESSHGNLLLIIRFCISQGYVSDDYGTTDFLVMRIDVVKGKWTMMNSLENDAIFIGGSAAISIPAANFPDIIKPNCIYFTDDNAEHYYHPFSDGKGGGKDMGIFNIEDKTIECLNIDSVSLICAPLWIDSSIIMS